MLGGYALCAGLDLDLDRLLSGFGALVAGLMALIALRHRQLQRRPPRGPQGLPTPPLSTACKDRP